MNDGMRFPIEGAAVFADMIETEVDGEIAFSMPSINSKYTEAVLIDGVYWASKDGKTFVPAIAIRQNGRDYTAPLPRSPRRKVDTHTREG